MPVKVRCSGCSTVLNVPDKAAGKTVACPKCKEKIKVPASSAPSAPPAKSPASKPKPAKPTKNEGDLFGGMQIDDYDMDHDEEQICPYCATEMTYDDEDELIPVCANCGMNVETGQMDAKEKKRRARKGLPVEEYWGRVWKDSWAFVLQYPGLAVRTGTYFGLFMVLFYTTMYLAIHEYRLPVITFFAVICFLSSLGGIGWYWVLSKKIIYATIVKEELQTDRIFFDMFECMSTGLRALFWPFVVMLPFLGPFAAIFLLLLLVAVAGGPIVIVICLAIVYPVAGVLFPIAQVHFTSKYTYKGWILWEMIRLLPKNFSGAAYWAVVAVVVMLPAFLIHGGAYLIMGSDSVYESTLLTGASPYREPITDAEGNWVLENGKPTFTTDPLIASTDFKDVGVTGKITLFIIGFFDITDPNGYAYSLTKGIINLGFAFLIYMPLWIIAGFPLLFLMKANAVFAAYFQTTLGLVNRVQPNTPATFWVRFLSHSVDILLYPFSSFIVTGSARAMYGVWGLNALGLVSFLLYPAMIPIWGILWAAYNWWMYWVIQESSPLRTTMGKDGFGLVVIPEENPDKPITLQQANIRWFLRNISDALLGLPYLMAVFDPEKRTMHDKASKTRVVWKGDK